MAFGFTKIWNGIKIKAKSVLTNDSLGDIEVSSITNKTYLHNGTDSSPVVTEAHASTLTNKTIDADLNTITNIDNLDIKALAGIDASKIGDGTVSTIEFQYINSLTSNAQTQITNDVNNLAAHTGASTGVHGVTGSVVGTSGAQTLSSKTLDNTNIITVKDANLTIQDDVDATKQVKIQASSVATATTRTLTVPNADGTLVLDTSTQTVSNKTLDNTNVVTVKAANFTIQDDVDVTKQVKIQASGLATATTQTLSVPNASGALVLDTAVQTLTNKTLTSPAITTPTGLVKGDVGLGSVDNTSDLAKPISTATQTALDGKQPVDTDLTAVAGLATTGLIARTGAGTAAARTVTGTTNEITMTNGDGVAGNPTVRLAANPVLPGLGAVTIPSGAFADRPAAPSNGMLRYSTTGNAFEGYAGGSWGAIGGGGGGVNYITPENAANGTDAASYEVFAESSNVTFTDAGDLVGSPGHNLNNGDTVSFTTITTTTGIVVNTLYYVVNSVTSSFQVAATLGGAPLTLTTDGTGVMRQSKPIVPQPFLLGSPTIALTAEVGALVNGANYFKLAKPASNVMGQGFRKQFNTGGPADYAKPMTVSFDVLTPSGYTDGDLAVWIHDNTNGVYIQPSAFRVLKGSLVQQHVCEFQTASNSSDYDIVVICTTVGATAYDVLLDTLSVKPNTQTTGGSITDWEAYTPTISGFGTPTAVSFFRRRVGGDEEIKGVFTSGTPSATNAQISLAAGRSIDTTRTASTANVGDVARGNAGAGTIKRFEAAIITASSTTGVFITFASADAVSPFSPTAGSNIAALGEVVSIHAVVPISGWGTSQVLSSETSSRVVSSILTNSANLAITAGTVILNTATRDTHGSYNTTTGIYTVPAPGFYDCQLANATLTGAGTSAIGFKQNADPDVYVFTFGGTGTIGGGSTQFYAVSGDTIRLVSSGVATLASGAKVSITRISGPAQIAASEKVYCQYTDNGSSSITADVTLVPFSTKVVDSHGAWNGTEFTAPLSSWYDFFGTYYVSIANAGGFYSYVNGVQNRFIASNASTRVKLFKGGVYLKAGEKLSFRADTSATLTAGAQFSSVSIVSQG